MTDNETPEVDIDEFAARRADGVVVDVRESDEYAEGHVPGAVLMPMGQLAGRLVELDRSAPLFVICASGNRSKAMTEVLRSNDFDARSVAGGTSAWIRSGRSIEKGLPR